MEITNKDIERVEKLFFSDGSDFKDDKDERYDFIKCLDKSVDVHACPGSGKTTSLLAKLYLLSEKMPFADGRSICVLTHTNVAIDTIKKRLGSKANSLFRYPNFFGTIQSFIDRYLAIPALIEMKGIRPKQIDKEFHNRRIAKLFFENTSKDDRWWLYYRGKANGIYGRPKYVSLAFLLKYVRLKFDTDGKVTFIKKLNWDDTLLRNPTKDTYKVIFEIKNTLLEEGILSFDDAYSLAKWYLKCNSEIEKLFSNRFGHVFIDEMQDTYPHQLEIIEQLFNDSVNIQRIGDLNQAILAGNDGETAWAKDDDHLKITGSWRFSQPIANVLRCVALEPQEDLEGFNEVDIPPHIITYDENDQQEVLEKFVELISQFDLYNKSDDTGYPLKAIGWVGKEKDGLTIDDYFPDYNKKVNNSRRSFPNFVTLIACSLEATPKEFKDNIINGLLEILFLESIYREDTAQQRSHSKTSLLELIKDKDQELIDGFLSHISGWYLERKELSIENIHEKIINYFENELFPSLEIEITRNGKEYLEEEINDITIVQAETSNMFNSSKEELNDISVKVDTVHSVKGETHTATLYLETKYYNTCGNFLIDELKGIPYDGSDGSRKEMCIKVAHVGFSRPTDLLCVALDRKLVNENREELEEFGWEIID